MKLSSRKKMAMSDCLSKSLVSHLIVAGVASVLTYSFVISQQTNQLSKDENDQENEQELSGWLEHLWHDHSLENVDLWYREWNDRNWRQESGWKGCDFIHNKKSMGPRILQYFLDRNNEMLIGVVVFGPDSESHQGLCHGGTMTAVLDDVLGHTAFVTGKGPWSGATISVNCTLKKPVLIGQILKVWGKVIRRERKKCYIEGGLVAEDGTVHASLEGITVECTRDQLLR